MQVKLYLHGHLRNKIQKDYVEVEASTVIDALRYLAETYKKELKAPLDIGRWKIKIKDFENKTSWYVPLFVNELHIYPVFKTAKSKWVSIGVGALLVVGAVLMGPWTVAGFTGAGWISGGVATFMATTGFSLMLTGIMNLLYPTPKTETANESSSNSKYLGAQGNTAAAGTRIPFGYGLFKVAGHYLSFNVSSTVVKEYNENVQS